jgi:uncharacterized protein YutE (UPF0331/DUF86 family)
MSPRDLDTDVIQARLAILSELLADMGAAGTMRKDRLEEDRLLRRAVERILSQLVEVAVAINSHVAASLLGRAPSSYRDSFRLAAQAGLIDEELALRLEPSVGLRNILTHEYVEIDLVLVAASAEAALVDYGEYASAVHAWLLARSG